MMCGWGTAGETPGLGNTRPFQFFRMNSGPSGMYELSYDRGVFPWFLMQTHREADRWVTQDHMCWETDAS